MSTVDPNVKCPKCRGYINVLREPQCRCDKGDTQEPFRYGKKVDKDEPPPPPCPKCNRSVRTRIWTSKEDGVHIFCSDCGWMERDPDHVEFKVRFCDKCGRVPIAWVFFDMPDEKTLDDSMLRWQCCGTSYPVWPSEVKFWCHVYIGLEESNF